MTNDDIIRMAREAGLEDWTVHGRIEDKWVCLKKFADLVVAELADHSGDATEMDQEIEAAMAEPVQEPYCYVYEYDSPYGLHREFYPREYNGMKPSRTVPLYAAQPQRKPLTDGEIYTAYITATNQTLRPQDERLALAFARAIERAHGIGDA